MSSKRALIWLLCRKLPPLLVVLFFVTLGVFAYAYPAILADLGDTEIGPPIAQEALRAFIVAQVMRAFVQRWDEFTGSQRLGWSLAATGIILNLARGHFGNVPLTLSFLLLHLGLIVITWRLMSASRREKRLARNLDESEQIRRQQDEVIADLHTDLVRVGQQSKEFEIRARTAEQLLERQENP